MLLGGLPNHKTTPINTTIMSKKRHTKEAQIKAIRDHEAGRSQAEICKAQTQARNTLGGLPYIVDAGNTYIADRTDSAHVNLRSYENALGAASVPKTC